MAFKTAKEFKTVSQKYEYYDVPVLTIRKEGTIVLNSKIVKGISGRGYKGQLEIDCESRRFRFTMGDIDGNLISSTGSLSVPKGMTQELGFAKGGDTVKHKFDPKPVDGWWYGSY